MRRWPLLLLALPAAVATWSGWVKLGEATGFGEINPLPGILDDFTINTAITLPIGVEAYAAYALNAWLDGRDLAPGTRRFAKWSAIGSLLLGMAGQVTYHLMEVFHRAAVAEATKGKAAAPAVKPPAPAVEAVLTAPWPVVVVVSCLPVLVLGMGAALWHLLSHAAPITASVPEVVETLVEAVPVPPQVRPQVHPAAVPEPPGTPPRGDAPPAVEVLDETLVGPLPEPVQVETAPPVEASPAPSQVHPSPASGSSGTPPRGDVEDDGQALDDESPVDAAPQVTGVPGPIRGVPEPTDLHHEAARRFFFDVARGDVPGVRRIKEELNIGQEKAQDIRAYLNTLSTA